MVATTEEARTGINPAAVVPRVAGHGLGLCFSEFGPCGAGTHHFLDFERRPWQRFPARKEVGRWEGCRLEELGEQHGEVQPQRDLRTARDHGSSQGTGLRRRGLAWPRATAREELLGKGQEWPCQHAVDAYVHQQQLEFSMNELLPSLGRKLSRPLKRLSAEGAQVRSPPAPRALCKTG